MNNTPNIQNQIDETEETAMIDPDFEEFTAQYLAEFDIVEELMGSSFEDLVSKYTEKKLFNLVFATDELGASAFRDLEARRHTFMLQFWPTDQKVLLTSEQRKRFVHLVASLQNDHPFEYISAWFKQINPNFQIPDKFNIVKSHQEAYGLYIAFNTVEKLLLNQLSSDYIQDARYLAKLPPERLMSLEFQLKTITDKVSSQYELALSGELKDIDKKIVAEAADFLGTIGRSNLFISDLKENDSLGQIADILVRLDISLKAVMSARKLDASTQNIGDETLVDEINKILQPGLQI